MGHCKALAPKYDILAQLYVDGGFTDKVTIAKVDATLNDVPDEIQGFPTIKLYKAGDKKNAITYMGSRSIEDLIKFVKENGKHAVEVTYEEEPAEAESQSLSRWPSKPLLQPRRPRRQLRMPQRQSRARPPRQLRSMMSCRELRINLGKFS